MKRVYVTTIHRKKEFTKGERLGNVYVVDWETKEFLTKPSGLDPGYSFHKPLSKSHGVRGISFHGDKIFVAGSGSNLSCFDKDTFELVEHKEIKELIGIHHIRSHGGLLNVVSTGNDTLFKLDGFDVVDEVHIGDYKEYIEPHMFEECREKEWGTNKLHFNSIGWGPDGDEYHIYCGAKIIFNFTKKEVVYSGEGLNGPHDLVFDDNSLFFNNSETLSTCRIDLGSKGLYEVHKFYPDSRFISEYNTNGFTRGLAKSGDTLFMCGSPTRVCSFDIELNKETDVLELSDDLGESIFDIILDPRDWEVV